MKNIMKVGLWCGLVLTATGCGQVFGVQRVDLWGAKMEFNSGFEVKAGAMQYDHSLERKGINIEARDTKKIEKY